MNPSSPADPLYGLTKNRIEALCDNVFSIALTLLVLELEVPEIPQSSVDAELLPRLLELAPKLQSYALSFASLGLYWLSHHFQFHFVRHTNSTMLLINFLILLHIAFLPFSTALFGDYPHSRVGVVTYGGNLTVLSFLMLVHWRYITGRAGLVDPDLDVDLIRSVSRRSLVVLSIFALAIGISFVSVEAGTLIYLISVLSLLLPVRLHRRRRPH
jgi:uncharacterized membrane protein